MFSPSTSILHAEPVSDSGKPQSYKPQSDEASICDPIFNNKHKPTTPFEELIIARISLQVKNFIFT